MSYPQTKNAHTIKCGRCAGPAGLEVRNGVVEVSCAACYGQLDALQELLKDMAALVRRFGPKEEP